MAKQTCIYFEQMALLALLVFAGKLINYSKAATRNTRMTVLVNMEFQCAKCGILTILDYRMQ